MEYANGATGVFITTTGEAPGTNRLEIAGERGKVVVEGGKITFIRNEDSMLEFSKTCPHGFGCPGTWHIDVPFANDPSGHWVITQSFVNAILDGTELIAPAEEGINSVELANSIIYSSMTGKAVDLPLDAAAYEKMLKELIANSRFEKKVAEKAEEDMNASFK
jgi:predicted dehydrogenase